MKSFQTSIIVLLLFISCFYSVSTALAVGPAGVDSGLELWFSADSGAKTSGGVNATNGQTIETWEDQSDLARTATREDETGATFSSTGLNYNPTIAFNNNNYTFSNTGLPSGSSDRSIFVVASTNDINNWRYVLGTGTASGNGGFDFGNKSGSGVVFLTTHNSQEAETGSWSPLGTARLAYGAVTSETLYLGVNGAILVPGGSGVNTVLDDAANIGANSNGVEPWYGNISEVIMFDRTVTDTERQRVNSYLALKYGFSLDQNTPQNYLASGSNLMWDKDASGAATYDNGLFGIGRDDASNLAQLKSQGQTSTNIIILEAEGEGANGNPDFNDIEDLEFLVIGDNAGSATWTATGAPSGYSILSKQWKKQEQGNVGPVTLDFDVADADFDVPAALDADDYYFVYDTDNDNSLADETPLAMNDQGSNLWRTTVDFGTGGLFSLASTQNPAISSLSPADNATGVSVSSNLVITFSQSVEAGEGDVIIKKSNDDSVVETIPAGSPKITGGDSTTITINPTNNLGSNTEYYVLIDADAFEDGDDNFFGGISSDEAWNFTTETISTPTSTPTPTSSPSSSSSQSSNDSSSNTKAQSCTDQTPSSAPNLFQISTSLTSATLYFSPVSPSTGYIVNYGSNTDATMYATSFNHHNNDGVVSHTINNLSKDTIYYFKIQAKNGCKTGEWSQILNEKTTSETTNFISDLISSSLSRGSLNVLDKNQTKKSVVTKENNIVAEPTVQPISGSKNATRTDGYDVIINVINNGKPVEGATVEVHSTPRRTKTDKDGIARFMGIEGGDHTVYIAHTGYRGEEKITLDGEEKEININFTVELKPSRFFLSSTAFGIITALIAVILLLFFLLWKNRKKQSKKFNRIQLSA